MSFSVRLDNKEMINEAKELMGKYDIKNNRALLVEGMKILNQCHGIDQNLLFSMFDFLKKEENVKKIQTISKIENAPVSYALKEILDNHYEKAQKKAIEVKEIKEIKEEEIISKTGNANRRILYYLNQMMNNNNKAKNKEEKEYISMTSMKRYMKDMKGYTASSTKISNLFSEEEVQNLLNEHHKKHKLDPEWNRKKANLEKMKRNAEKRKKQFKKEL